MKLISHVKYIIIFWFRNFISSWNCPLSTVGTDIRKWIQWTDKGNGSNCAGLWNQAEHTGFSGWWRKPSATNSWRKIWRKCGIFHCCLGCWEIVFHLCGFCDPAWSASNSFKSFILPPAVATRFEFLGCDSKVQSLNMIQKLALSLQWSNSERSIMGHFCAPLCIGEGPVLMSLSYVKQSWDFFTF